MKTGLRQRENLTIMAKTTGSDLLIRALQVEGVDTVFGVAGDHILQMLDTMFDAPLRMVDFRHESGAVHLSLIHI